MMTSLAYLNYGRWVADCPVDGCSDARALHPEDRYGNPSPQPVPDTVCAAGHPYHIETPPAQHRDRLEQAVSERPLIQDRGWYPKGHGWAELNGYPTGQSVDDLRAESSEVASVRAQQRAEKDRRLREALSSLGVEVRPDGSFSGTLPGTE
jgi:hypothetical protein